MRQIARLTGLIIIAVLLSAGISLSLAADPPKAGQINNWNFDKDKAGTIPAGSLVFSGNWAVRAEADVPSSPNALCQTGKADYPAVSVGNAVYTDVSVTTLFKSISGNIDRAAGIIFRIKDKNNYYILRANALEDNVNIYKYVGGLRREIQGGTVKVPSNQWQELRVEIKGNHIIGFLNAKKVVESTDDTFKSGRIGLWTKEDSVTCFDNVQVSLMK